jgi:hypothetical protein
VEPSKGMAAKGFIEWKNTVLGYNIGHELPNSLKSSITHIKLKDFKQQVFSKI